MGGHRNGIQAKAVARAEAWRYSVYAQVLGEVAGGKQKLAHAQESGPGLRGSWKMVNWEIICTEEFHWRTCGKWAGGRGAPLAGMDEEY